MYHYAQLYIVLGIKPKTSCVLSKHSIVQPCQPFLVTCQSDTTLPADGPLLVLETQGRTDRVGSLEEGDYFR